MTDHLAEARHRLIDQSFVSGKADMAAGILHNIGNAVTPITVRLNTLTDRHQVRTAATICERAVDGARERSGRAGAARRSRALRAAGRPASWPR